MLRRGLIMLAVGAIVASCGGGPANHASPASARAEDRALAKPCDLLSNDDINAALNAPITKTIALARASCSYMLPSAPKEPGEVDVLVAAGNRGRTTWQVDLSDPVATIGGIGDEAWTITRSQYHKLGVRSGDLYVFVTVVQDDPDKPGSDALKALAQAVLQHVR
jgi:hypothetical protein